MSGGATPMPETQATTGAPILVPWIDWALLGAVGALLAIGVVMVASSSVTTADRGSAGPFYFLWRQLAYVGLGLALGAGMLKTPLAVWERLGGALLVLALVVLGLVLVPGIGREVNGSVRWLALGSVNLQPSEAAKPFFVIYLAGYLVRQRGALRTSPTGFLRPMLVLGLLVVLLLLEPDFGAVVVLTATALGMLFLGGVRLWEFVGLLALAAAGLVALAVSEPYRLARLTTFLDPWADPFNSGFQLTQALIAFGRGQWLGVGLGDSVQKLFYLPEAHTDFLFAVIAEELGLLGALVVMGLFAVVVWRAFAVARAAERSGQPFAAWLAYGLGLWLGLQTVINLGVNMGVLPTKGLTLPLMSYGGSSILASCAAVGLLLRVHLEASPGVARRRRAP